MDKYQINGEIDLLVTLRVCQNIHNMIGISQFSCTGNSNWETLGLCRDNTHFVQHR